MRGGAPWLRRELVQFCQVRVSPVRAPSRLGYRLKTTHSPQAPCHALQPTLRASKKKPARLWAGTTRNEGGGVGFLPGPVFFLALKVYCGCREGRQVGGVSVSGDDAQDAVLLVFRVEPP